MVYSLKGRRYLKKYTAAALTPVYAAATDAQAIVDALCDIPWQEVKSAHAQMSYHTDKMLDRNVEIRDSLDAAAFCANHAGGLHRAYANAACYVFELPDMETYPNLTSVKARVVSDPYNSGGVRLAVHVSDTLDIPLNCAIARTGVAHVEGVVPRETRIVNGASRWYAATEEVEIPVSVVAKKYLFLVVALENYSLSRGDWLEGSAFIAPTVEIVTDGELSGWPEDGVITAVSAREFVVLCQYDDPARVGYDDYLENPSTDIGTVRGYIGADWYFPSSVIVDTGTEESPTCKVAGFEEHNEVNESTIAGLSRNVNSCYAGMFAGRMRPVVRLGSFPSISSTGAAFTVGAFGNLKNSIHPSLCSIHRRKLLVPFHVPAGFGATKVRMSWTDKSYYVEKSVMRYNLWLCRGRPVESYEVDDLQDYRLWTASTERVGEWELVISKVGEVDPDERKTYSEESDLELSGGSRHTFLCTCYIPPESFDLVNNTGVVDGKFRFGMGWDNIIVIAHGCSIVGLKGIVDDGWNPGITLLS